MSRGLGRLGEVLLRWEGHLLRELVGLDRLLLLLLLLKLLSSLVLQQLTLSVVATHNYVRELKKVISKINAGMISIQRHLALNNRC